MPRGQSPTTKATRKAKSRASSGTNIGAATMGRASRALHKGLTIGGRKKKKKKK